ncbi:Hypothetical protein CINCED_3A014848 [Cinara cedri]|uniref:Uncharacterized protein n=1 Tax=Cinara cedri TaxID=506608 RepID=A0A5E4N267_9HEMI|nr:Hypothetical protein CINCED_3A014848 [Cinara cedri]
MSAYHVFKENRHIDILHYCNDTSLEKVQQESIAVHKCNASAGGGRRKARQLKTVRGKSTVVRWGDTVCRAEVRYSDGISAIAVCYLRRIQNHFRAELTCQTN